MKSLVILAVLVAAALAAPKKPFGSIDFDRYWSLDEIYEFMDEIEATYPDIAEVEMMGRTEGGVEIRGLRITNEEHLGQETLPVIFVTAGTSARDWITTMAAVNLMHELTDHYEEFRNIVDNVEWFIIPIANPDGFIFSRAGGSRDWVKNRRVNAGSDCIGVNIERNFLFNFGLDINSSNDPCSDDFRGPAGDSEEETKTIQFAVDITRRFQYAYVSLKAATENAQSMVTYPFSSNNELFMPNFQDQVSVANLMTDNIWRQTGGRYRAASEGNAAGFISGTSGDYAAGRDQIPFVYTFYAERGDTSGWHVPIVEINRVTDEIFWGIEALANHVASLPLPDDMSKKN